MRFKHRVTSLSISLSFLAIAAGIAAGEPLFQSDARMPGEQDLAGFRGEKALLHATLLNEEQAGPPAPLLEIAPSDSDLNRYDAARESCATCLKATSQVTGPNLAAGHLVTFKAVSPATVGAAGKSVSGGLLKRGNGGDMIWTQRVSSPGAQALRLHFTEFHLASPCALYLFTDGGDVFGPYEGDGPLRTGDFWSNTVAGDNVYVVVRGSGPASDAALRESHFVLRDVAHILDGAALGGGGPDKLASCIEDGSCFDSTDFGGIDRLRPAIAHMRYVSDGLNFVCTGGLVNDRDPGTFIPYFLTANHCISTEESAQSLECVWNFRTTRCGSGFEDFASTSGFPRTLGATLLANRMENDFSFMRLGASPPAGSVYLGWTTAAPAVGTTLYRLSHPKGAQQAFSTHSVVNQGDFGCIDAPESEFVYTQIGTGATDGGSSGSPVVAYDGESLQVVGQLYGSCGRGDDVCDGNTFRNIDGRFSVTFAYVEQWLNTDPGAGDIPPNDAFANPSQLVGNSSNVSGSNINATQESGEPVHAGNGGGHSVWWRWTAPQDGSVTLSTAGSGYDTVLAVYTGTALEALNPIAANDNDGGQNHSRVTFDAAGGETYQLAVDGAGTATGAIALDLAFTASGAPVNDPYSGAITVTGESGMTTGSNVGGTKENGEPDHGGDPGGSSVWWRWTAPGNGQLDVITLGSNFDTTLGIYAGSAVNGLTMLASNDDTPDSLSSRAMATVTAGTTYSIAVDGYSGAQGQIALAWTLSGAVPNDQFAEAEVLTGDSGTDSGSNVGASHEDGEPDHGYNSLNSVWWRWQAPANGAAAFDTRGSDFDTVLAAYTGTEVGSLTPVASNDDTGGERTSAIGFSAKADTVYLIAVAGYSGGEGAITLSWVGPTAPRYTLELSAEPASGGNTTVSPAAGTDGRHAAGTELTVTAAPATGFHFTGWTGALTGNTNPAMLTINRNETLVANFEADATPGELADELLAGFTSGDGNTDGFLSFAEGQGLSDGLTRAAFDELDTDNDGLLSRDELQMIVGSGCGCPSGKAGAWKRLDRSAADLFLLGLALLTLTGWRTAFRRG